MCISGISRLLQKIHKKICKDSKAINFTHQTEVKFEWTPEHQEAFMKLKDSIIQAPILCYPNPNKKYIVYTDALDDACRAQLTQEHDGTEFPIAFLSHTFQKPRKNGVPLNKRPMEYIMP